MHMIWVERTYSFLLILSSLAALPIGLAVWMKRRIPGALPGGLALLGSAIWMVGYLFELRSDGLAQALLWAKLQYVGIVVLPSAWTAFVLQYSGARARLSRRGLGALVVLPALILIFVLTNDYHHLFWVRVSLLESDRLTLLDTQSGPILYGFVTYAYGLIALCTLLTLQLLIRTRVYFRLQVLANVFAALLPWLAAIHDAFRLEPLAYLDLAPLAFSLTSFIIAWNLLRWNLADIIPVARGAILESMDDAVIVIDHRGRIVDLNAIALDLLDRPASQAVGEPVVTLWPELATLGDEVRRDGPFQRQFQRVLNGGPEHYEARTSPLIDPRGRPLGKVIVVRNITEQKQAEAALRASEERYALAARGANDGLWDWDLVEDRMYLSPRWKAMLGYQDQDVGSTPQAWLDLIHPDDRPRVEAELEAHIQGHREHFESEHRVLHSDGSYRWMLCRGLVVRGDDGSPHRMAGSQTNITEQRAFEDQLKHDALHDSLTGLPNRVLLSDRLEQALERARREPTFAFALLFLDLDRFKVINDSLGHLEGDNVLTEVGERLRSTVRSVDTVARLGGDEFVLLLEGIHSPSDATRAAERVQSALVSPIQVGSQEFFTSASIGIALSSEEYDRPEDVIRDADIALYRAKANGRARHEIFDTSMHARAVALLHLETDLRRALEDNALRLHYQPIQSLSSGRVIGLEALLRWQHPQRGLLLPKDFLDLAEETGLIVPMGTWVLNEASRQMRAWQEQFPGVRPLTMSVNVSGKQLMQDDLLNHVASSLEHSGLEPGSLRLEITENVVMEDSTAAAQKLEALRKLGVQIHIDDFGTGYSSLGILHRFPVDVLKIDRSFIRQMGSGNQHEQIVRTIIALARSLGIEVVAEGVETESQLEQLRSLECGYGQGYFLARPDTAEVVTQVLQRAFDQLRAPEEPGPRARSS